MGLLNKLLDGGAEGCRKSMRGAYEHHAKAAREKHMDSPHLIGLYGALRSRYRARGLAMDEAVMWGELAPFLAMEPAMSIAALSEYVAFQEQHRWSAARVAGQHHQARNAGAQSRHHD